MAFIFALPAAKKTRYAHDAKKTYKTPVWPVEPAVTVITAVRHRREKVGRPWRARPGRRAGAGAGHGEERVASDAPGLCHGHVLRASQASFCAPASGNHLISDARSCGLARESSNRASFGRNANLMNFAG